MANFLSVSPAIRKGTQSLIRDWKQLNLAYQNFAKKKLEFAQKISRIWEQAKQKDERQKITDNQNHLREQLRQIIRSDNKSILSRWVSIGQNASELLRYADALPSQRDSLYALSLAVQSKKPIGKWISNGKLSTESTVREVLSLSKRNKKISTPSSKMMDVMKISYPQRNALKNFGLVQEELEEILRGKDIPFVYCGIYARYEKDLKKHSSRIDREHLKLVRKFVKEKISRKIDYVFYDLRHNSRKHKTTFQAKLKELKIAPEEADVRNCRSIDELQELYERMELNEDGDWNKKIMELYGDATEKFQFPESVRKINAAKEKIVGEKIPRETLPKRKNNDFTQIKV